ncbi:type I polyketide synthase [Spiractinospora alimapuensis]|uniref:acyltransferase domain-containing protein n=1 Tax=Spiractinospora alimapuensis TaxID=2820884 RepID=UPI001F3AE282|nr:type I polyketide synthase [Spiractinospora alimapuensis]QVQ53385.1 type I polyketide synthase [Spiractinospora alimapuensis]
MTPEAPPADRVVLVGIGCRLPGTITTPTALWQALLDGRVSVDEVPQPQRQQWEAQLAPQDRPTHPRTAGMINFEEFDHTFFGLPPGGDHYDPLQRVLLEVAFEALQDSSIAPSTLAGGEAPRAGIYVGSATVDPATRRFAPGQQPTVLAIGGGGAGMLGSPLARHLDARGPLVTFDTSCSSGLTAAHYARRDLESRDVDVAIVCGVNSVRNSVVTRAFADGGVLSEEARPFDVAADGYVRAEMVVVTILMRHTDTQGRRAYASILTSRIANDGRSPALGAPRVAAQAELLRDTWTQADIPPAEVPYLHTHGTATRAGDRAETEAIARAGFGTNTPVTLGTAKANFGHGEGAAGVLSLAATALTLHHGHIPPTPGHQELPARLARLPIAVPTQPQPWPDGARRVAGVTGIGFSGATAHAVLGYAPASAVTRPAPPGPVVVPVSAHTPAALAGTATDIANALTRCPAPVRGVAATAITGRDHHTHRAAVVASRTEDVIAALRALAAGEHHPALAGPRDAQSHGRVVWVFPGQGRAEDAMGQELYAREPVYRAAIEKAVDALPAPGWHPARGYQSVSVRSVQQATFAHQVALAALWRHWGLRPDVVIGHSLGELAAAHIAGVLDLDDATRIVTVRSGVLERAAAQGGGLMSTSLPAPDAAALVENRPGVAVAALNGPQTTVLSGPHTDLDALHHALTERGVHATRIPHGPPAHSPALTPALPGFARAIHAITPRAGHTPIVSSMTGQEIAGTAMDSDYWTRQLRAQVDFHGALTRLLTGEPSVVMEIATRTTLAPAVLDTIAHHELPTTALTADNAAGEHHHLLTLTAHAYTHGLLQPPAPDTPHEPLPPMRWDYAAEIPPDLADRLHNATPQERATLCTTTIRALVATIAHRPITTDTTDLASLGLGSLDLARLHSLITHHTTVREIFPTPTSTITDITNTLHAHLAHQKPRGDR